MNAPPAWEELEARLRPFVARRVAADDVDDVLQDVWIRLQRGLGGLREDQRFTAWLFQVARSAIADHGRARARHPLPVSPPADDDAPVAPGEPVAGAPEVPGAPRTDDPDVEALLAACVAGFVARLPSPYREAVTLVELEGLTAKEAAALVGVSVSGMKSRVQRGRARLRALFEECCEIALDVRGRVTDVTPRPKPPAGPCCPAAK